MPMFKRDRDPFHTTEVPVASAQPTFGAKVSTPAASATIADDPPVALQPAAPFRSSATSVVAREAAAVIDKKTEITGTLHSQGHVLIEGCFQGEIEAKETVSVEKGAQTQGQLRAKDAVISGSWSGEIACEHRLQITASATVSGEIKTPVLVIEEGATVNCRFSMTRTGR